MTYPTNSIPSINPQNFAIATPIGLQSAARDPTAQDNTYIPGTEWQNTVTKVFWKCESSTIAGAVWTAFVPSVAGTVSQLTGNSGAAVGPDGMGNINVVGDGTTITIAGNPGTNTLTASLVGGGVASQSYTTNVGGPVTPTAAGVVNMNASTSTYTNGATANTIKTELQGTNHALFVGRGALTPATTIATGTSGQALVSAGAGSDPAFGTLGVVGGGTGDTSFTAYAVITGGTTSTGPLQNVVGLGTSGQVLTSNGAAALPTWQSNANGNVSGPGSSTDRAIATWNGTTGTALFDNSTVKISSGGVYTNTTQPGFYAYLSAATTNDKTGDGTVYKIIFDATRFNVGTMYNVATGIATIPTTGDWIIGGAAYPVNLTVAHTSGTVSFSDNATFSVFGTILNVGAVLDTGNSNGVNLVVNSVYRLTAGQLIQINCQVTGSTKTIGFSGSAANGDSYFYAKLLG